MPDTTVRRMTVDDVGTLADLAIRTFEDTFAAFNDPKDMEAYMAEAFATEVLAEELADPDSVWFLASVEGVPAGFAKVTTGDTPACVAGSRPVELARLYAVGRYHGRGVGHALMEACLDEAQARGGQTIWLGVWERNDRAIAFYRKWGFERCGAKEFVLGTDVQTDDVMARPLGDAAAKSPA